MTGALPPCAHMASLRAQGQCYRNCCCQYNTAGRTSDCKLNESFEQSYVTEI